MGDGIHPIKVTGMFNACLIVYPGRGDIFCQNAFGSVVFEILKYSARIRRYRLSRGGAPPI